MKNLTYIQKYANLLLKQKKKQCQIHTTKKQNSQYVVNKRIKH